MEETRGVNQGGLPSLPAQLRQMLKELAEARSDLRLKESEALQRQLGAGERGMPAGSAPGDAEAPGDAQQALPAGPQDIVSLQRENPAAEDVYRANREAAFSLGLLNLSDDAGVRAISGGLTPFEHDET